MNNAAVRAELGWGLIAVAFAGIIALTTSLQIGFFTLLFIITAWWTWHNEELALLSFIALVPLLPMFKLTQSIGNVTLLKDIVILTLFLKLCVWPFVTQTLPYRRNMLVLPLLALIGWVAVGVATADSLTLGILRARDIGLYILLYLAVLYLPHSKEIMKRRLLWLAGSAVVLLLAGLYQYLFAADSAVLRFDPVRKVWLPRMSSTFGHPTVFGEYLTMISALTAGVFIKSKQYRLWATIILLGLLPFVYLTYSRGVWLGYTGAAVVMLAAWMWARTGGRYNQRLMWQWVGSGVLLVVLIAFLGIRFTPAGTFVRTAFDPTYRSNQIRLEFLARLVGNTSNSQALFGHGLGDISQKALRTVDVTASDIAGGESRDIQLAKDSTLVDNQYLKTFIELGLVGLLLYAWLYVRLYIYAFSLIKQSINTHIEQQLFGYAMIGFLTAFLLQALFVDIWDVFPTNAYFWILVATLSTYSLATD